jgi:3',5'-cyclic AMP phosphodiesterase CpdA
VTTTILHVSDLHFGEYHAPERARVLLASIEQAAPDVVAVSGDLTQRARPREFEEARAFLDRIRAPKVVVPGNHDIPLWNVFERFSSPRKRYLRHVTDDLEPTYVDDVVAVVGVDTTRRFTVMDGRVDEDDLAGVERRLAPLPPDRCRIVVGHHPLVSPAGSSWLHSAAQGGLRALERFSRIGVDAVLTGHLHESHVATTSDVLPHLERGVLLVNAGTASSTRGRGAEDDMSSFNVIEVRPDRLGVTTFLYAEDGQLFRGGEPRWFQRHPWGAPSPETAPR